MIHRRPVDLRTFSALIFLSLLVVPAARSQSPPSSSQPESGTPQSDASADSTSSLPSPAVQQQPGQPRSADQKKAAEQLQKQEHQRILGVIPNFNTSYLQDAESLSAKQKFRLMWKSSTDPVIFGVAAIDAGYSQLQNDFPGYHQGMEGYAKRLGASYADTFDGALWGNAILPVMLHQDPRYFRKGTGTVKQRIMYAIAMTVICKGDNGKWQPNYSNVIGNVISGGTGAQGA